MFNKFTIDQTCIGFDESDFEYPRLNLTPLPPIGITLPNREGST
jgi:hypothetical protein